VLQPGAERVRIKLSEPTKEDNCRYLGEVTGNQGNAFTGAWTSNKNMETGARNDMKNKAAAMGANTLVLLGSRSGSTQSGSRYGFRGQQTNVTTSGIAYNCPEGQ